MTRGFNRPFPKSGPSFPQDDGSSEERQLDLDHYRKHAAELGLPFLEHLYYDRHKSGFHGDNLEAEFGRMMFDIQNGDVLFQRREGRDQHSEDRTGAFRTAHEPSTRGTLKRPAARFGDAA